MELKNGKMIDFDILAQIGKGDNILRPYQIDNKVLIYDYWSRCNSVMLQMPTGTGKTKLFVSVINDIKKYGEQTDVASKILVLVHRKELIEQISTELNNYEIEHGFIQADVNEGRKINVQIASVQTLNNRLQKWIEFEFDFIIIDEAHHTLANSYKKIIEAFQKAKLLGVTATPYRMSGEGFQETFEKLIVSFDVGKFVEMGVLSEYDYYSVARTSYVQKEINNIKKMSHGDYNENEMIRVCDNNKIRAQVVNTYMQYAIGKKGIVYTINKEHNKHLCEEFNLHGICSVALDSDTPKEERKKAIEKFKKGDISIICNVDLFSEGFDCPDIEFIQLARPTKSLAVFLQQVGRGLRYSDSKEKTIFLDNVGLYNRFGLPDSKIQWQRYFKGNAYKEDKTIEKDTCKKVSNSSQKNNEYKEGNEKVHLIQSSEDKEYIEERTKQLREVFNEYNEFLIEPYNQLIKENGLSNFCYISQPIFFNKLIIWFYKKLIIFIKYLP